MPTRPQNTLIAAGALVFAIGIAILPAVIITANGSAGMEPAQPAPVQPAAAPGTLEVTPEQADELTSAICETLEQFGADEGSRIVVEAVTEQGLSERQGVALIAVAVADKCEGALD